MTNLNFGMQDLCRHRILALVGQTAVNNVNYVILRQEGGVVGQGRGEGGQRYHPRSWLQGWDEWGKAKGYNPRSWLQNEHWKAKGDHASSWLPGRRGGGQKVALEKLVTKLGQVEGGRKVAPEKLVTKLGQVEGGRKVPPEKLATG